jgi:hypothetical protein
MEKPVVSIAGISYCRECLTDAVGAPRIASLMLDSDNRPELTCLRFRRPF